MYTEPADIKYSFLKRYAAYSLLQPLPSLFLVILGASSLPEPTKKEDVVVWYPWTINNKYYTANVSLCVVPSPFSMNAGVAQSTQAFIVYFDSKAVSDQFYSSLVVSHLWSLAPSKSLYIAERWPDCCHSLDCTGGGDGS